MASRQHSAAEAAVQAAIGSYYHAINARDIDALLNVLAADGSFQYPGRPPARGRDAIRRLEEQILGSIDTITLTPDQTFIDGDRAAVTFSMRVTARNGRSASMEGIDTFQVNPEGKLQHVSVYYDAAALSALVAG